MHLSRGGIVNNEKWDVGQSHLDACMLVETGSVMTYFDRIAERYQQCPAMKKSLSIQRVVANGEELDINYTCRACNAYVVTGNFSPASLWPRGSQISSTCM